MIMESALCAVDCLNLATVFDGTSRGATHFGELTDGVYMEKHFVDEVHMTDSGNKIVSSNIARYLSQN